MNDKEAKIRIHGSLYRAKRLSWVSIGLLVSLAIGAQPPPQPKNARPCWAFLVPDAEQPPAEKDSGPRRVPGSSKTYTFAQIEDRSNTPDWFPEEHAPPPVVIQRGNGPAVKACGSCHLMSGHGHPKSADLAGLPAEYLTSQVLDFKRRVRSDPNPMLGIAEAISADEARKASEWFAALKPARWVRVLEADTVPKSYVRVQSPMLLPKPGGGTEPLGSRIIELPEDATRATNRDPHSGFVAYVPVGSVSRGEKLVTTGVGKTIACRGCHGDGLRGAGLVPRIAGQHPIYIFRQLYNYQNGTRAGSSSQSMSAVVSHLSEDDMIAIAAYTASLEP